MAETQVEERFGSSNDLFDNAITTDIQRSKFDLSRKNLFTADVGMIIPIDIIPTLPNDDFDISIRYMIDTMPLAVPPMNNYKVRTHWYYCRCSDLWRGFPTFATKGRNENLELTIPQISNSTCVDNEFASLLGLSDVDSTLQLSCPHSLMNYLGIAPLKHNGTANKNYLPCVPDTGSLPTGFNNLPTLSALPFMMYQKIYRDNYAPINFLQSNEIWYPNDLSDEWRISYNGDNLINFHIKDNKYLSGKHWFVPENSGVTENNNTQAHFIPKVGDTSVDLLQLRYACFDEDIFTSAKPWLVRGEETPLKFDVSSASLDFTDAMASAEGSFKFPLFIGGSTTNPNSYGLYGATSSSDSSFNIDATAEVLKIFNKGKINGFSATITANTLRSLIATSLWQESNALVNGNYNSLIGVHFKNNPNYDTFEPIYIGGTSDYIQFSDVLQTTPTSESPLGSQAGLGRLNSSGYVGRFHSTDYGFIMGVMIVSPEVVYADGVEKFWTDKTQSDLYFPEFANLGFQPILNERVFVSNDDNVNNNLFGYSTRYLEYKTRLNKVSGLLQLKDTDLLFSAYAQSRYYPSAPSLSLQFVTMSPMNLRRDWLSYPSQPAFKVQFASDITAIRPLPYQCQPSRLGM